MEQYTRWGLTSIHDAGAGLESIAIYKKLLEADELPVRVYAMVRGVAAMEEYLDRGPEVLGDGKLVVRGFKVILDGALGSRGAELNEPYSDAPEEIGLEQMSDEAFDDLIRRARVAGFQVNPHVIGDRAVRRALDAFERAVVEPGERHRLEHASIIAPDDLSRLAQMGIVASMQPVFVGESTGAGPRTAWGQRACSGCFLSRTFWPPVRFWPPGPTSRHRTRGIPCHACRAGGAVELRGSPRGGMVPGSSSRRGNRPLVDERRAGVRDVPGG